MHKGFILYLDQELSAGGSALESLLQIHGNLCGGPAALATPERGTGGSVLCAAAAWARRLLLRDGPGRAGTVWSTK